MGWGVAFVLGLEWSINYLINCRPAAFCLRHHKREHHHQKLYATSQTETSFSTLVSCLQGPSLRQTHTPTKRCRHSNKREKAKKKNVRREKERIQQDEEREREGVNNLKTKWKSQIKSMQMESQRKSIRWRRKTLGVSLRPQSHRPEHRAAPTPTEDVSLRLSLSLCVFHTLSIHIC